jgi:hypothetical protein
VLVKHAPPGSALVRAMQGPDFVWGVPEQLMAGVLDALNILVWFKTEDGAKGRNRPKQIPRPGVEPDEDTTTYGKDAVSIEEMNAFLGWESQMTAPEDTA